MARLRAKRHSDSDFVCALSDRIGQHARKSDSREQERQCTKEAQEPSVQSFLSQRGLRARSLSADFGNRQGAVQFAHNLANGGGERSRFPRRAQDKIHLTDNFAFLPPGCVEKRLDLFALAHVLGISDDTDDFDFSFAGPESDVLAERVIVGEIRSSESLIGDGHKRCVLVILICEAASPKQRYFHCRKIVLASHLPCRGALPGGPFRLTGEQDAVVIIVLRDERNASEGRCAHAWQVVQTIEEPLIELQQLLVFVTGLLRLQSEEQEVTLIKAKIDSLQVVERADEQT